MAEAAPASSAQSEAATALDQPQSVRAEQAAVEAAETRVGATGGGTASQNAWPADGSASAERTAALTALAAGDAKKLALLRTGGSACFFGGIECYTRTARMSASA